MKYLSCPDIHVASEWLDVSRGIFHSIITAAREHVVDFVLFPGDLHDRALYSTSKGGTSDLIEFIEELRAICPIFAIYGTPSHDYHGAYDALRHAGLVVVRPGFGYGPGPMMMNIEEVKKYEAPKYLIFGIPEPTKEIYIAKHPDISADRINFEIEKTIERIIVEQVAPYRTLCPDIPMIAMFHGNVSDALDRSAETDVVMKASDIVIKTSVLNQAGMDRWEFGHIHQPWESKKMNAGYAGFAGIDRNSWGKVGFIPAMNLGTIIGRNVTIERIPYGTPMRVKIDEALPSYDPSIAYWLDTNDKLATVPTGHPWSRISYKDETEISRRVSSDVIEAAKTLQEMALLFDPGLEKSVIVKIAEVVEKVERPILAHRDVRVESVEVTGSILWGGVSVVIDIAALQPGLTQLIGANGSGKSSLAGWCTPYPGLIGKDTDSGRMSAIKDFFDNSESGIKKRIICNGEVHEHLITIRGAHTKTPKVECYLTIDGRPALEKSTFDEMFSECERRYGSLADYLSTSFYVQPLQGKAESGLMTASMATVRDLVLNIAGIDYTAEKDYALGKIRELERVINDERVSIEAIASDIPKKETILADIEFAKGDLINIELNRMQHETAKEQSEQAYNLKKLAFDAAESNKSRVVALTAKIDAATREISAYLAKIEELRQTVEDASMYEAALASDAKVKAEYDAARTEWLEVERRNNAAKVEHETRRQRVAAIDAEIAMMKNTAHMEYQRALNEWTAGKNNKEGIENRNSARAKEVALIRKPCAQCGYIAPDIASKIMELESEMETVPCIVSMPIEIAMVPPSALLSERTSIASARFIPEVFELRSRGLDDSRIAAYRAKIEESNRAGANITAIETDSIPQRKRIVMESEEERSKIIIIDIDISAEIEAVNLAKKALEADIHAIARARADIERYTAMIADIDSRRKALDDRRVMLDNRTMDMEDWRRIDAILSPSKLPAFELEVFLDVIDHEATECIRGYRNGRYIFKSMTQKEGSKTTVDKFAIMVHDCETGQDKSFLAHSVGEKSFLNTAYVGALVKIRSMRSKTSYSPIILDENDSFVDIAMIPGFYEMQRNLYEKDGAKVLVISHSPDCNNYIHNSIEISSLLK